jgi:hypothetical protein
MSIKNKVKRWIESVFPATPFMCGREITIEFKSGKRFARIVVIQPDGETKLQYSYHTANKLQESKLKDWKNAEDKIEFLHITKRKERDFVFFDRIFKRAECYIVDGKKIEDMSRGEQIELLKKWHPEHIEVLIYKVFDEEIGELSYKKKD